MPSPCSTATQFNLTTNASTFDNIPSSQVQVTSSAGYRQANQVEVKKYSCNYCNKLYANKKTLINHRTLSHLQTAEKIEYHKELINSHIIEVRSKIRNQIVLQTHEKLISILQKLSSARIYAIFNEYIPAGKPQGLEVFLNKLTLFMEAFTEKSCYQNYQVYRFEYLCNCFVRSEKKLSLKHENIRYFMQQTDEQILQNTQSKEKFTLILKSEYPKKEIQDIFDHKLQERLDSIRHDEVEKLFPSFLDSFKSVCKQKKIYIHTGFLKLLNKLLSFEDLPVDKILKKIIYFFYCIDDQNPYIDTSIIHTLFFKNGKMHKGNFLNILKYSPQVLEQIAKNPQLIQHTTQCKDVIFSLTVKKLEDKNIIAKLQTDSNIKADEINPPETVIDPPLELSTELQICNAESSEEPVANKQQDSITLEKQIQEVINRCHTEKRNILNDSYVEILSTCLTRSISIEKTLFKIFNALSTKYITSDDTKIISNKLVAIFENLPENITIENTAFLEVIFSNKTNYTSGLSELKKITVDNIIETIKDSFRADFYVEEHDLVIDLNDSQTTELDNTLALLSVETPENKKRYRDNDDDDFIINYKKLKTS